HRQPSTHQSAVMHEELLYKGAPVSAGLDMLPLKVPNVDEYLDKNRHVELKDTAFHYFLNVSDYRPVGEQEPYEFARRQVKDMLLNVKQVEFMKQVKDDLYQRAVKRDKIKYYLE
ncbi:MAG: peptidyl-prolyl cis-trans isomerase, partial [Bacteroides uniformis]|nr:peptidyl-prolyl cis-trans isomerase [Bacteroides uniformis]